MPPKLHPLPEDLRTTGRVSPLAVSLPGLQGCLQGHHALQLVGGTYFGSGVDTPTRLGDDKSQRKESREGWDLKQGGGGEGGNFGKGRWRLFFCRLL